MKTAAKICGLTRHEDAVAAAEAGADYLGVVFAPGTPRNRTAEEARRIWSDLPIPRVGVFVDPAADRVASLAEELQLAVVQLHGAEDPELCRRLRESCQSRMWKSARLRAPEDVAMALDHYGEQVDGLLVEGWSELGPGGVGAGFDWSWAAERRLEWPSNLKLILAGGLDAGNVGRAIDAVRPDVVDVSSGVERVPGVKDMEAVRSFLQEVRRVSRR